MSSSQALSLTPPVQVGQRWFVSQAFTSLVTGVPFQQREEFDIINLTSAGQYELARIKDCSSGLDCTISSDEITKYCICISGPPPAPVSTQTAYGPGLGSSVPVLPVGINQAFVDFDIKSGATVEESIKGYLATKCECGAHSLGLHKHSDWCQLYSKDQ